MEAAEPSEKLGAERPHGATRLWSDCALCSVSPQASSKRHLPCSQRPKAAWSRLSGERSWARCKLTPPNLSRRGFNPVSATQRRRWPLTPPRSSGRCRSRQGDENKRRLPEDQTGHPAIAAALLPQRNAERKGRRVTHRLDFRAAAPVGKVGSVKAFLTVPNFFPLCTVEKIVIYSVCTRDGRPYTFNEYIS